MTIEEYPRILAYASDGQKDLLKAGFHLRNHVDIHGDTEFEDYSFVVFPFAKAYEGFLKQAFLDKQYITHKDFVSKFFRIGRVISPNLVRRNGDRSVYKKICDNFACELGDSIWHAWKFSRNEVFHYFPHNLRSLTLEEADERIMSILNTMDEVIVGLKL